MIYRVECVDCNLAYIGQTAQYMHKRLNQHKTALNVDNIRDSALVEHRRMTSHNNFILNNLKPVLYENNWRKRIFKEAWYINSEPNCLNRNWERSSIPKVYYNLFQ